MEPQSLLDWGSDILHRMFSETSYYAAPTIENRDDGQLPPTGISISENQEKGGVEIRFPERPDESIIERLKSAGFRWSRFAKCWWIKKTDRALTFAADLARELSGTVEQQGQEEYCLCGAD